MDFMSDSLFDGRRRDECLNTQWFGSIPDAVERIEAWRIDYNEVRPHSRLGYRTPASPRHSWPAAPALGGIKPYLVETLSESVVLKQG